MTVSHNLKRFHNPLGMGSFSSSGSRSRIPFAFPRLRLSCLQSDYSSELSHSGVYCCMSRQVRASRSQIWGTSWPLTSCSRKKRWLRGIWHIDLTSRREKAEVTEGTTPSDRGPRLLEIQEHFWCYWIPFDNFLWISNGFLRVSAARERYLSNIRRARGRIGISELKLSSWTILAGVHKPNSLLYIPSYSNPSTKLHHNSHAANTSYPKH